MHLFIPVLIEKTQGRQHSQQEEDNRYRLHLCARLWINSLCAFPRVRLCLSLRVLFSFHGWVNSSCLSLTIMQTLDKSLAAMNTVWALLYRLTDDCVVLVSQCYGAELGRRSFGSRYHCHHRAHLCCTFYAIYACYTGIKDWKAYIQGIVHPKTINSGFRLWWNFLIQVIVLE